MQLRPNNVSIFEVNFWQAIIDSFCFFKIFVVFETRLTVKATLTWNLYPPHAPLPVLKMGATIYDLQEVRQSFAS